MKPSTSRMMVIETEGVKREAPLPADFCVSRKVAFEIRDAMTRFIEGGASYGWVTVHCPVESAGANTEPIPWAEPAVKS